ncbi:hypothetical protein R3W88_003963 [Solanum pinnatisectum]|uniref:Uncharacterized protein n=1 Tax=Solanum pinnatisectum TaxID=50273 RepID=A0AAV9MR69_9SOLN|nr:hypothetical protein R3W88_003963 [Solanum pinnatisectum]
MLFSRVDRGSHKWIDAGNQGKRDELIRKKKRRRNHSAPPFYQGKNKFFSMSESTRKAAGNHSIKTVHDVPLILGNLFLKTIAVSRLHHSAEAICWELPQQSSHQCDQSSTSSCSDSFFCDERELVNIWNSKLQAQGECTCTGDGEICTNKNLKFLRFWDKMEGLSEIIVEYLSYILDNLNNQYTILSVTSGVLHFVGDSLVPDTIDKTARRVPKFSNRLTRSLFFPLHYRPFLVSHEFPYNSFTLNDCFSLGSFGWTLANINLSIPKFEYLYIIYFKTAACDNLFDFLMAIFVCFLEEI